jgi:hypothetical protein
MRYRKISPRLWKDEKFITLSQTEKLISLYCITAQSNRIGLFNFSPAQAAEDLGMDTETFGEGFGKVCERLNWTFDKHYRVLYLPTWWKYNAPENPNVLKSCLSDLHEVPQTPLIAAFFGNMRYLPQTFHETFRKGLAKPSPNQEQEQEQEQEYIPPKSPKRGKRGVSYHTPEFEAFYEAYPRKVNKPAAFRAWKKIAPQNGTVEQIMAALALHEQTEQWQKENGQYIPHPAAWLNGRRWEDQIEVKKAKESWREE